MKRFFIILPLLLALLTSCSQNSNESAQQTAIASSIMQQIEVKQTQAALVLTPTITPTPLPPTFTPTPTSTPLPTYTPTWIHHEKQTYIYAPILLYHHILTEDTPNRYNVSLEMFNAQMQALQSWGYTSITVSTLANAIRNGGDLPEKPILITFDDGDIDIYENAFPIMKKYGFVGTFYIVGNRLQSEGFVKVDQLKELVANGWEIGSHGYAHTDMSKDHGAIESEGRQGKKVLQDALGISINSFAYPYGGFDYTVGNHVAAYGYTSGMGLGTSYIHSGATLYYLSRMEVWGTADMNGFSVLLPWSPVSTPIVMPQ